MALVLGFVHAGRLVSAPPSPPPEAPALREHAPLPPEVPATPLTPEDDWLAAIAKGGWIRLGPGEFLAAAPIELAGDIGIVGTGSGLTTLNFTGAGAEQLVMMYGGEGENRAILHLEGLRIIYTGVMPADLVVAWGDIDLTLHDVGLAYARDDLLAIREGSGTWRGHGLIAGDGAAAYVRNSWFADNDTYGIYVLDAHSLVVEGSAFLLNDWAGIHAANTPLTVAGSSFRYNGAGVEMRGAAPRQLLDNTFESQAGEDISEGD